MGALADPLLAVLAGLAGSVQVAVMARLGERVGVFAALAWAAMLTAGLAFALLLIVRQGAGGIADAARSRSGSGAAPRWGS